MDISNFMSWFVSQVVRIFTWCFNTLDSIQFGGTTLLRVLVTIVILVPLLSVFLTLGKNGGIPVARSEKVRSKSEKDDSNNDS